ncbi:MAG: hypothetical protein HY064_07930 [Bacteroidetes bacterium]|nr:hypothetical protein [Bacteroidota bacterium]
MKKTCFRISRNFFLAAGCVIALPFISDAQTNPAVLTTVSPYSHYGIGDLNANGTLFNSGMGGGGIGMRNDSLIPQYINLENPASFTSHPLIAYEITLNSNTVMMQSNSAKTTFNRTSLGSVALAFPVKKWWGAGFGLMPYSNVGYNVNSPDSIVGIGPVTYKYEGSGGVNQLFLVNAFRPFAGLSRHYLLSDEYATAVHDYDTTLIRKKLKCKNALGNISIGVNSSFMFGTINNVRRDVFPDSMYTFNTKITKRMLFHDLYLTYGVQYSFRLPFTLNPLYQSLNDTLVTKTNFFHNYFEYKRRSDIIHEKLFIHQPGVRLSMGLVFAPSTPLNVSYDLLAQTYKQIGTLEQFRDTVISEQGIPSRVVLPLMGGVGFELKKDYKWAFQADYMTQLWSQSTILGVNAGLKNSTRITAGFQYQPRQIGRGNYLTAIQYRLGARYYITSLEIHGIQLTETSVNLSLSFPVPYRTRVGEPVTRGTINFEYGMRGTTNNQLIKENFFRVTFGVTINDRWFNRIKYD